MAALTSDGRRRYPGIVIYGVGDDAHRLRISDHNEDDTSGSRAAQSDPDSTPEHRAIDMMLGPSFTRAQALALINEILARPDLLARLIYINFENYQWARSSNWIRRDNFDDPHPDHIHFSGLASDDENSAPWLSGGDMYAALGDTSEDVKILQEKVLFIVEGDPRLANSPLVIDGNFGARTAFWVSVALTGGAGNVVTPAWFDRLNDIVRRKEIGLFIAAHLAGANHGGKLPDSLALVIPEMTVTARLS